MRLRFAAVGGGITRSSSTATATLSKHGLKVGQSVTITGADQSEYNGTFTITAVTTDTFSYTVAGTPASGTGTIRVRPASAVWSNNLLSGVRYPDKSSGSASAGQQEILTYNALGQRVIESVDYSGVTGFGEFGEEAIVTDLYYSQDWQVIEQRLGATVKAQYTWSTVYVDAMVLRDRDTEENGPLDERMYVAHDANFNVTALIETDGDVAERFRQDAYGVVTVLAGNWSPTVDIYSWIYLHQGGRYDSVSGLYHFRHRDYSPSLGRWVQVDPIRYADGMSLYQYERLSPLNYVDPEGEAASHTAPLNVGTVYVSGEEGKRVLITINVKPQSVRVRVRIYVRDENDMFKELFPDNPIIVGSPGSTTIDRSDISKIVIEKPGPKDEGTIKGEITISIP